MSGELGIEREQLPIGWDAADAEQDGFTAINIQTFLQQCSRRPNIDPGCRLNIDPGLVAVF
jgi:hypothetical protein